MVMAALIVSIGSAAAALAAAAFAARQVHQARIANAFPAVIDMFGEYRSATVSHARTQVFTGLRKTDDPAPLSRLPTEIREPALTVCHYLDNFGVLVFEGLMDAEIAARFLGNTAVALWERLLPHIDAERLLRQAEEQPGGADYLRYFEDLAVTLNALNPEHLRSKLKRWRG
jgi:hypothetical protein